MSNKKRVLKIIEILLISVAITVLAVVLLHDEMFTHHGRVIITDWSQCQSNGYEFDGQKVKSIAGDPYIYFYSDSNVDQIEVDVTMVSNVENMWNKDFYGEEVIYAELFWADENGEMNEENAIPFKINLGRNSYLLDVDCPAGTLFRLDIGDGEGVEFSVNSFVFNTYEEYSTHEKIKNIVMMYTLVFVVLITGFYFITRKEIK